MAIYDRDRKKPCVAVPNDVFNKLRKVKNSIDNGEYSQANQKTAGSDVVGAFTLYFIFLIRMDYANVVEYQMSRLVDRYFGVNRSETYKVINRYLFMLKMAGLIDYSGESYTGKSIICVKIIPVNKPFTLIACINEKLIARYDNEKSGVSFALHCLLNINKKDKGKWVSVEIPQDILADYLDVKKETIRRAVDRLELDGFISRTTPQHYTTVTGNIRTHCLMYTVHDYDESIDNSKAAAGRERQKIARRSKKDDMLELRGLLSKFGQTPILLIGGYVKALEGLCRNDLDMQNRFCNMYEIETVGELESIIDMYDKIDIDNQMYLAIFLPCDSRHLQDRLLKFVENNPQLPFVILSEHDDISATLLSRMKHCLKKSQVKVREMKYEPVHKGLTGYAKKHIYYNRDTMLNYALDNCPELLKPTVTNESGDVATIRIDNLISKLTGGKSYIDVLDSIPDPAADTSTKIKYLSLSSRRNELEQMLVSRYESEIQAHFEGD